MSRKLSEFSAFRERVLVFGYPPPELVDDFDAVRKARFIRRWWLKRKLAYKLYAWVGLYRAAQPDIEQQFSGSKGDAVLGNSGATPREVPDGGCSHERKEDPMAKKGKGTKGGKGC